MSYDFLWSDKHPMLLFTLEILMILYCTIVFTWRGEEGGEEREGRITNIRNWSLCKHGRGFVWKREVPIEVLGSNH